MRAIPVVVAALVGLYVDSAHGLLGYGSYREAQNTYYEILTECEREGGECKEIDFNTPEPPKTTTPAPPPSPPLYLPPRRPLWMSMVTAPPTQPPPFFPNWNWPYLFPATVYPAPIPTRPALPVTWAPRTTRPATWAPSPTRPVTWAPRPTRPVTWAPRPTTLAPRPTTLAPRPTTLAPRPTTKVPVPPSAAPVTAQPPQSPAKKPRKPNQKKRKPKRRMRGEQEIETRRRRAVGPDPFEQLYQECTGGWEFDLGCSAKGKNVCCHSSSSSGSSYK